MVTDPYSDTVQALLALGGQRVWSLMVSLFGDLAQRDGTAIEGPVLSAIMSKMDVRPEAVRVALHRLRNEDWIASEKTGRTRRHYLTPKSRAETIAASPRIYGPPGAGAQDWLLVVLPDADTTPAQDMPRRGFVPLLPRVYVGAVDADPPPGALRLEGSEIPHWLPAQIAPAVQTQEYAALLPILRTAARQLDPNRLSPRHIAVLRCLIVHNWRRIVLRHPTLPDALLPPDWPGRICHGLVNDLLTRFARPSPDAILPDG